MRRKPKVITLGRKVEDSGDQDGEEEEEGQQQGEGGKELRLTIKKDVVSAVKSQGETHITIITSVSFYTCNLFVFFFHTLQPSWHPTLTSPFPCRPLRPGRGGGGSCLPQVPGGEKEITAGGQKEVKTGGEEDEEAESAGGGHGRGQLCGGQAFGGECWC